VAHLTDNRLFLVVGAAGNMLAEVRRDEEGQG
jgi:hypothetical protein